MTDKPTNKFSEFATKSGTLLATLLAWLLFLCLSALVLAVTVRGVMWVLNL